MKFQPNKMHALRQIYESDLYQITLIKFSTYFICEWGRRVSLSLWMILEGKRPYGFQWRLCMRYRSRGSLTFSPPPNEKTPAQWPSLQPSKTFKYLFYLHSKLVFISLHFLCHTVMLKISIACRLQCTVDFFLSERQRWQIGKKVVWMPFWRWIIEHTWFF